MTTTTTAPRIRTVKLGPDAAGRGTRIRATVNGRRRTVPYDYAAGAAGTAEIAAALIAREVLGMADPVVTLVDSDPARGRLFTVAERAEPPADDADAPAAPTAEDYAAAARILDRDHLRRPVPRD